MKIGYFKGEHVKNNVNAFLEKRAKETPDRAIFYWIPANKNENQKSLHSKISFSDFSDKSARLATGFTKLGIVSGDRVIVFLPMSVEMYLVVTSLQRIGAIPVFLDSWSRRSQLETVIQKTKPKAMVSFGMAFEFCKTIPEACSISLKIEVGENTKQYSANLEELYKNKPAPILPVESEHTALITFTTGSSGTPKGADRSHRFLAAQHYALKESVPYKKMDIDLCTFPVFALNNIATGITTVIPAVNLSEYEKLDPAILVKQTIDSKATCANLSPAIFNKISAFCINGNIKLPKVRRFITGGAPISRDDLLRFQSITDRSNIVILYGSTEVEPITHITADEWLSMKNIESDDFLFSHGVNVGKIVKSLRYRFIKLNKGPVEIRKKSDWKTFDANKEVGELIVAGEHVCDKYYDDPTAWSSVKIKDIDGTVWHRTGDVGKVDKTGYLWIIGRVHNAILRNNVYYFPIPVEILLKKLPFVSQSAYLGIPNKKLGEKAVIVISPIDFAKLEENKNLWSAEISKIMRKFKIPVDDIFFLEKIPMDPRHHSKIEYEEIRKQIIKS
jgi:acyl-CoA synthetase (AMP-forming)/AMP-acid ligase II